LGFFNGSRANPTLRTTPTGNSHGKATASVIDKAVTAVMDITTPNTGK
jgi:chorismate synthase